MGRRTRDLQISRNLKRKYKNKQRYLGDDFNNITLFCYYVSQGDLNETELSMDDFFKEMKNDGTTYIERKITKEKGNWTDNGKIEGIYKNDQEQIAQGATNLIGRMALARTFTIETRAILPDDKVWRIFRTTDFGESETTGEKDLMTINYVISGFSYQRDQNGKKIGTTITLDEISLMSDGDFRTYFVTKNIKPGSKPKKGIRKIRMTCSKNFFLNNIEVRGRVDRGGASTAVAIPISKVNNLNKSIGIWGEDILISQLVLLQASPSLSGTNINWETNWPYEYKKLVGKLPLVDPYKINIDVPRGDVPYNIGLKFDFYINAAADDWNPDWTTFNGEAAKRLEKINNYDDDVSQNKLGIMGNMIGGTPTRAKTGVGLCDYSVKLGTKFEEYKITEANKYCRVIHQNLFPNTEKVINIAWPILGGGSKALLIGFDNKDNIFSDKSKPLFIPLSHGIMAKDTPWLQEGGSHFDFDINRFTSVIYGIEGNDYYFNNSPTGFIKDFLDEGTSWSYAGTSKENFLYDSSKGAGLEEKDIVLKEMKNETSSNKDDRKYFGLLSINQNGVVRPQCKWHQWPVKNEHNFGVNQFFEPKSIWPSRGGFKWPDGERFIASGTFNVNTWKDSPLYRFYDFKPIGGEKYQIDQEHFNKPYPNVYELEFGGTAPEGWEITSLRLGMYTKGEVSIEFIDTDGLVQRKQDLRLASARNGLILTTTAKY